MANKNISAAQLQRIREKLAKTLADEAPMTDQVISAMELTMVLDELDMRRRVMALGESMAEAMGISTQ